MLGNLPFGLRGPPYRQLSIGGVAPPQQGPQGPGMPSLEPVQGLMAPLPMPSFDLGGNMAFGPLGTVNVGGVQRVETDAPLEISLEVSGSNQLVTPTPGLRYFGFTAKETSETDAATAVIRRGANAGAPIVAYVNLSTSEATGTVFPQGIRATEGLYFELLTGAMSLVAFYKIVPER